MDRIAIAGPGRLGQALGRLLHARGLPVSAIAGRDPYRTSQGASFIGNNVQAVALSDLSAYASRILIAVPDDALPSVAHALAVSSHPIHIALHTCGSRGPEALAELENRGASVGALHPLQTISTPDQGVADLPGAFFGITTSSPAGGPALKWALEICDRLNGHPLTIAPDRRPLYHAAAVMASNYVVTLLDAAGTLMSDAGVPSDQALPALAPLIRASVHNALTAGPAQALTGPIERGDTKTIAAHLSALRDVPQSVRNLYRSAGLHALALARRKNPATDRREIESLLEEQPDGEQP